MSLKVVVADFGNSRKARTLQLGQEVECQLELGQDLEELLLTGSPGPHRQQPIPGTVPLPLVVP